MIRSTDSHAGLKRALELGDMAASTPRENPAEKFTANAQGKAWFVNAEMVRPLGGRRVGGRVARREPRLEVTVRPGGRAAAEALMTRLNLDGTVHEQRPIPHGRRHGR